MKLKRILTLCLALILMTSVVSIAGGCFGKTKGLAFELNDDGESYTLIGFNEDIEPEDVPEEITVPETYEKLPVTKIGARAFNNYEHVTKITLPDTIEEFGASAFFGCSSLAELNMPANLKTIGSMTFSGCKLLSNLIIPDGMKEVPKSVFADCAALTEITIPATVKSIKPGAFSGCGVKKLTIPNAVTTLESGTFKDAAKLEEITIGAGVTEISSGLFDGCTSLKKVTLTEGLLVIREYAFSGCAALESITIPKSVRAIYQGVFAGCINLNYMKFEKADCYECSSTACAATIAPDSIERGFTTHYHSQHWRTSENAGSAYVHNHWVFSHDISNPEEAWKMFVTKDLQSSPIGGTLHNYPNGGLSNWSLEHDGYYYKGSKVEIDDVETGKKVSPTQIISKWDWDDSNNFYWYNGTKGEY